MLLSGVEWWRVAGQLAGFGMLYDVVWDVVVLWIMGLRCWEDGSVWVWVWSWSEWWLLGTHGTTHTMREWLLSSPRCRFCTYCYIRVSLSVAIAVFWVGCPIDKNGTSSVDPRSHLISSNYCPSELVYPYQPLALYPASTSQRSVSIPFPLLFPFPLLSARLRDDDSMRGEERRGEERKICARNQSPSSSASRTAYPSADVTE